MLLQMATRWAPKYNIITAPIGLNSFPIVVRTDRKENTAALLLPYLQALQFQYIILILRYIIWTIITETWMGV
jgi:hypothetical protein